MTDLLQDKSLFLALGGMLALAAILYVTSLVLTRKIRREAEDDWDYQVRENMQDLRLDRDGYIRAYTTVHAPRKLRYIAGALAALALLAIPAFTLIERFLHYVWIWSGQSRVFEPPFLVWQFSIYFSILAFSISVVWLFHRRYYLGLPGQMRDALIRERMEFIPDKPLIVGPNPAQLDVRDYGADGRESLRVLFEDALELTRSIHENWAGSGYVRDTYSDGSDMVIEVYMPDENGRFNPATHPFFFPGKFARANDKPRHFLVLRLLPDPYKACQIVLSSEQKLTKTSGGERSRVCSLSLPYLDIYIYQSHT